MAPPAMTCPWCGMPVKPYNFKVERDGEQWHDRCAWAEEAGLDRPDATQLDLEQQPHPRTAVAYEPEPTDEEIAEAQADYERRWGSHA